MEAENFTAVTEFILVGLSSHRKTQILLFVVILIIYSVTMAGNLVIILLVRMDSRLHTPMYFFLMHLSGLEICYVSSTVPQMLAHLLAGNGVISFARCATQMYTGTCTGAVECFLLAAMAYDRYLAICNPLLYASVMGRRHQIHLASTCWFCGFCLSSINVGCTLHLPYCGPNLLNHFVCEVPTMLKLACTNTNVTQHIVFFLSAFILLVPLSVILTSYILILFSVFHTRSGWRKALSTCGSHLAVVTLFYGTIIFMYMVPRSNTAPDRDKQIAFFYIVVTPLLNPIIYTLRNKHIHGAVARVLQKRGVEQKCFTLVSCVMGPDVAARCIL